MRRKIQRSMIFITMAALMVAYAILLAFEYRQVRDIAMGRLTDEAEYIAGIVNSYGPEGLEKMDSLATDIRFTLIDREGSVLYDTDQDAFTFGNHRDRPEVQSALAEGKGQDIRKSDTLGMDMFYAAVRLSDGNVLRIAQSVRSILFVALEMLPMLLAVLAGMLIFSVWLARRQARQLVRPINELKLDAPLENDIYEELHPLLERIDEQNRAKDAVTAQRREFSANVSHELKTPLTSISGYAEIMKDGLVRPEDVGAFSERIYRESQRLIVLIDDIISLSKLDEGVLPVPRGRVELMELCRDICESLELRAQEKRVQVELSGKRCEVVGVRQLLQEMIYNIVENAVKYNREGGRVSVWVGETPMGIRVLVTDTGIGIPEDQLDRIFERFYRVDKSHSRDTGGTGLGLSIAKHCALVNHAQIMVRSRLGEGTQMEIAFEG